MPAALSHMTQYFAALPYPILPHFPQSPHTFMPSLQLAQISISDLPFNIFLRKSMYSGCFQISLKDLFFKSPIRCFASLSKQQGTTIPSQVITGECQRRQQ